MTEQFCDNIRTQTFSPAFQSLGIRVCKTICLELYYFYWDSKKKQVYLFEYWNVYSILSFNIAIAIQCLSLSVPPSPRTETHLSQAWWADTCPAGRATWAAGWAAPGWVSWCWGPRTTSRWPCKRTPPPTTRSPFRLVSLFFLYIDPSWIILGFSLYMYIYKGNPCIEQNFV